MDTAKYKLKRFIEKYGTEPKAPEDRIMLNLLLFKAEHGGFPGPKDFMSMVNSGQVADKIKKAP